MTFSQSDIELHLEFSIVLLNVSIDLFSPFYKYRKHDMNYFTCNFACYGNIQGNPFISWHVKNNTWPGKAYFQAIIAYNAM